MAFDVLSYADTEAYNRYFAAAIKSGGSPLSREAYDAWRGAVTKNHKIITAARNVSNGTATHIDTHTMAEGYGEAASAALQQVLTPNAVGAVMEREIALATVDPVLRANYSIVSSAGAEVQKQLYKKAGFGLAAQTPEIDADRLDGLIEKLCNGDFEKTRAYLGEPVINFTEHVADELVRRNAEFQTSAGFEPYVERILAPGCCDWCSDVAGRYPYTAQPRDLWRRHRFCRCVMDYQPSKQVSRAALIGGGENRNTKKWVIY